MIKIRLFQGDTYYTGLQTTGHAPTLMGKKGENILCAGISTLAQTLYIYLKERNYLRKGEIKNGYLEFTVKTPDEQTQQAFELVLTGFRDLQQQYPDYIELQE